MVCDAPESISSLVGVSLDNVELLSKAMIVL